MCDLSLNVVLFAEQPFVLWVLLLPAADVCSACRVAAPRCCRATPATRSSRRPTSPRGRKVPPELAPQLRNWLLPRPSRLCRRVRFQLLIEPTSGETTQVLDSFSSLSPRGGSFGMIARSNSLHYISYPLSRLRRICVTSTRVRPAFVACTPCVPRKQSVERRAPNRLPLLIRAE